MKDKLPLVVHLKAGYNDSASIQNLRKVKSNTEEDVEYIVKHCPKYALKTNTNSRACHSSLPRIH